MIKGSKTRSRLAWLEGLTFLAGVLFLAQFFYLKAEQGQNVQRELAVFHDEMPLPAAIPATPDLSHPQFPADSRSSAGLGSDEATPDTSLWSEIRIREYAEAPELVAARPKAVLTIDSLDLEVPVYNGTDDTTLNRGIGRILGTAGFDQTGNLGLAGHRDGFFRGLKDIQLGDELLLLTDRDRTRYRVDSISIVDPTDVSVLAPTQDASLTLVTCYPFYFVGSAPQRFIVKASAQTLLAGY